MRHRQLRVLQKQRSSQRKPNSSEADAGGPARLPPAEATLRCFPETHQEGELAAG